MCNMIDLCTLAPVAAATPPLPIWERGLGGEGQPTAWFNYSALRYRLSAAPRCCSGTAVLTISSFVAFALYERKNDKQMIGGGQSNPASVSLAFQAPRKLYPFNEIAL